MSPDVEASKWFYTKVLGWGTRVDRPLMGIEGQPPYMMWLAGGTPIAGMVPFAEEYWLGYVGVADVDRSVMQANDLGGKVVFGPHDIPRVGRFAVLEDPQGAAIAIYKGMDGAAPSQPFAPKPMDFSWHELATIDWRAALDFYMAMFGWEAIGESDMGPLGMYVVFGPREVPYGGMFNKPAEMPVAAWCYCVRVNDVNEAANKVRQNGGQVINGPMEVPGGDWIARCLDSAGGMFAVQQAARRRAGVSGFLCVRRFLLFHSK